VAFNFTVNDNGAPVKKGVRAIQVALNDTAGESSPINVPDVISLTFTFSGVFASGTVKAQVSNDNATWSDALWLDPAVGTPAVTPITAATNRVLDQRVHGFRYLRLVLAAGGATTAIVVDIVAVLTGGKN
jgi:hypothetical protein